MASSPPTPHNAPDISEPSRSSVRWGCGDLVFEFESSDESIRAAAESLFRPWLLPTHVTAPADSVADAKWIVESSTSTEGWVCQHEDKTSSFESIGAALQAVEFGSINKTVESCRMPSLHAALVAKNGKSLAIVGPCNSGKSTLAAALWQAGWTFLTDDVILLDCDQPLAFAGTRRVSIRATSRSLLGDDLWNAIQKSESCFPTAEGFLFHPHQVDNVTPPRSARLSGIVFLARNGAKDENNGLSLIEPSEALLALLPYTNLLRFRDQLTALKQLQPLANQVPAFDLGRTELPSMIHAIESQEFH